MVRKIPARKARQGGSSRRTLMVLVWSLVGAFVIWGIVEIYYFTALRPDNLGPSQATRDANVPGPASVDMDKKAHPDESGAQ